MKWIAICGSWRKINKKIEQDVRNSVRKIINAGEGIVTGGALNVDSIAADEALKLDPAAGRIKILLPTTLAIFTKDYFKRSAYGVITKEQAENLIAQLSRIQKINPSSIIENENNKIISKETYRARNSAIVEMSDGLMAFHANKSPGTQDTIDKARKKGIPVRVLTYTIE